MKFRKKPVVIEAEQMPTSDAPGVIHRLGEIARWCGGQVASRGIEIKTLEGVMLASPGDWVIRGVKGEFYPCRPDIFAATYDPA